MRTDGLVIDCKLCLEDLSENGYKLISNMLTVQDMDYSLSMSGGNAAGHSLASIRISVKLGEDDNVRHFLERMIENDECAFTILFNPVQGNSNITKFGKAIVLWGHITDIEEDYTSDIKADTLLPQTLLHIRISLTDLKYIGTNNEVCTISMLHS